MKSYSSQKPDVLKKCYGNRYLYHWDIKAKGKKTVEYVYNEVAVYAPLTSDKILRTVINELWDKDYEQKLLNDYNAYVLGVGDESAKDVYVEFLKKRAEIKAQVESDCKEYKIE